MANAENLQDLMLNELRREHTPVTMFFDERISDEGRRDRL